MKRIKKAVTLTMREYWIAAHGKQKLRPRPCDYPGFMCDCPMKDTSIYCGCWKWPARVNGGWKIRRIRK